MKKQRFVSVPALCCRQCHQSVISAALLALLSTRCTVPETPEPISTFTVENALSEDSVILWNGDEQKFYEIKLAGIAETNCAESRHVLLSNLDAAAQISFEPVGEVKADTTPQTVELTAEVFIDLGDSRQSVNEAQLLVGQATLRKDANSQKCPRLEAMKQAQQEAKDSRAGVWGNVK